MALFTRTAKLDPGVHGARCAWAMAVHHTVGISRQRNSGYKPSRVNIMAQGLSTPDPSLSPTHLYKERSRNTTLVPSLGLRIGPAYEAGLSAGMRRERVSPQIRQKERKQLYVQFLSCTIFELFNVEEYCDINIISSHSRSSEMAPFNRRLASSY